MEGEEVSILALTDGAEVELLPAAQDHKRLGEGDTGPNTGGMGAYSPVSLATPALLERTRREILLPTLRQLAAEGAPYRGVLYAGLMVATATASPRVVEFNCRLGDPETPGRPAAGARRIAALLRGHRAGRTPHASRRRPGCGGHHRPGREGLSGQPGEGRGDPRFPTTSPRESPSSTPAPAARHDGILRVAGGRVLNVTGVAQRSLRRSALSRAGAEAITYEGKVFRRDIGWREAGRQAGGP